MKFSKLLAIYQAWTTLRLVPENSIEVSSSYHTFTLASLQQRSTMDSYIPVFGNKGFLVTFADKIMGTFSEVKW